MRSGKAASVFGTELKGVEAVGALLLTAPTTRRLREPPRTSGLLARTREVQSANYEPYGYRRTWKALNPRRGDRVALPLMRSHGILGAKS